MYDDGGCASVGVVFGVCVAMVVVTVGVVVCCSYVVVVVVRYGVVVIAIVSVTCIVCYIVVVADAAVVGVVVGHLVCRAVCIDIHCIYYAITVVIMLLLCAFSIRRLVFFVLSPFVDCVVVYGTCDCCVANVAVGVGCVGDNVVGRVVAVLFVLSVVL